MLLKIILQDEESLEQSQGTTENEDDSQEGENFRGMNEERRSMLREIELKVMQYQDELESGSRKTKTGWSISQQVEHFRRKLLKRAEKGRLYEEKEEEEKSFDKKKHNSPSYG